MAQALRLLVFCGERSPWGYAHLRSLLLHPSKIVGVVFATNERWKVFRAALSGRPQKVPAALKFRRWVHHFLRRDPKSRIIAACRQNSISVECVDDVNSEKARTIFKRYEPDWIFSAAYPQIFKAGLLAVPRVGAANSHPSLLPRCRGAHPVFWALASGESETGGTIHLMTEELDAGDIITQMRVPIEPHETYSTLYSKLNATVPDLVANFLEFAETSSRRTIPQDSKLASYYRNDRDIHHVVLWSVQSAKEIDNLVRACDGGAYFWFNGIKVVISNVTIETANRNLTNDIIVPPGTVVELRGKDPVIAARHGFVVLNRWRANAFRQIGFEVGQTVGL